MDGIADLNTCHPSDVMTQVPPFMHKSLVHVLTGIVDSTDLIVVCSGCLGLV